MLLLESALLIVEADAPADSVVPPLVGIDSTRVCAFCFVREGEKKELRKVWYSVQREVSDCR